MISDEVEQVTQLMAKPDVQAWQKQELSRCDLLPYVFRIKDQPYDLTDRPQFREMFAEEYVPDMIYMAGRQLGKSISLSRSEVADCISIPHFQVLYVAPLQKQTQRYSTMCLREAVTSCSFDLSENSEEDGSDSPIVTSVSHQTFFNGSGIQLSYAKTSPDRTRGISADRIDFDEIQDQLVDNIPIITESLTDSNWGLRRFTGTAKTTDNIIESFWQDSSMCEWVTRCGCGHWNIPNVDGKVLEMIGPEGPICVKCGRILNVRSGQYVAAYPDRMMTFRGFHVPQIVVPAIAENPQKWSRLFNKVLRWPIDAIMQEILGISCSQGTRLITLEDIRKVSILPTTLELQKHVTDYVFTVGGVDWGVAEQTSFTVHTIIGMKPDGHIDVLYARRFQGFNPDEVLQTIAQAHAYYGCRVTACDYGMGFDKNIMLEHRFGLPIIQVMYCRQIQLMNFSPSMGHPRYTVDRTTALELMFMAIKYGRVHFPPEAEFKTYTDDLLALYETVSDSDIQRRYFDRNPNHADDFAHALCFAMMTAMRSMNVSMLDMVPEVSGGIRGGKPPIVHIDPGELNGSG